MVEENSTLKISIPEFVGVKQANLFKTLKQPQFTGQLILSSARQEEWVFYLYLGRIIYATGGKHPVRRWLRNIKIFAPHLQNQLTTLGPEIFLSHDFQQCWEYDLLKMWVEQDQVSREQITRIIRGIIVEILFDLTQTMEITFELNTSLSLSFAKQLVFINADQVVVESWQQWQNWQGAKLADRSPNKSPIIRQSEELKQRTSPKTYQIMTKLFNGKNSLRDLSCQLKQDLVQMTKLMIPYIQLGLIDLITIADLPFPWSDLSSKYNLAQSKANVVCLSNQFHLIEEMKNFVTEEGYNFISFNHPSLAMSSMLANPPQFIFLDLDFREASPYELLAQLRKLPAFQQIPIVIISNNINLTERMRGKIAGATEFLPKPLKAEMVKNLIKKHLLKLDKKNR
jgi:chemotaxis family two-component system response regulator PixG